MISTLLFPVQALTVTIYVALAVYVSLNPTPRPIHRPFILFFIIGALDAWMAFVLLSPDGGVPSGLDALLRLRVALDFYWPLLFLHMAVYLQREKTPKALLSIRNASHLLMLGVGMLLIFGPAIIEGGVNRGAPAAYTIRPSLTPLGQIVYLGWLGLTAGVGSFFLASAASNSASARTRRDSRRVLAAWILLVGAGVLRALSRGLPWESSLAWSLMPILGHVSLSFIAGLSLAYGILRLGSPIGRPIDSRLSPLVMAAVPMTLIALLPLELGHPGMQPIVSLAVGAIAGLLLALPGVSRWPEHWLGRRPPLETPFLSLLSTSWRSLAARELDTKQAAEMAGALQSELSAEFVTVLERMSSGDARSLSFGRGPSGPILHLPSDGVEWPITEAALKRVVISLDGTGPKPNMILPIRADDGLAGVLMVGDPLQGGVYGTDDVVKMEWLASFLAVAHKEGVSLVLHEESGPALEDDDPCMLPVPLAVRAFGGLQLFAEGKELTGASHVSIRARQILAHLLTAYPDPVGGDALMTRLWPDASPSAAANNLYVAIYSLRRSLEPGLRKGSASRFILREGEHYRLALGGGLWIDALAFADAYREGTRRVKEDDLDGARRALEEAEILYRGDFLDDSTLDLPAEVEVTRQRYRMQYRQMARFLVDGYAQAGRWEDAECVLLHQLSVDPWDELAHAGLKRVTAQRDRAETARRLEGPLPAVRIA